jgi:hypothetical protein
VRPHVEKLPEYLVAAEDLEITTPPSWVHTDLKAEVIRDAGLSKISILDEHTPQLLSEAFALCPWVDRVSGVHTSYPAHIRIDLVYRHPVAMVEVSGGLLPIDDAGVLLPTAGFSADEAHQYPRIAGIETSPRGMIGSPWGDPAVEQGAKLAAVLQDAWPMLRFHHIQSPRAESSDDPAGAGLQLVTRQGTLFVWGDPPGEESGDEAPAAKKLVRLKNLLVEFQSPDAVPAKQRDLRQANR